MSTPALLTKRDYLSAFMNIFWLRPETAVWRTLDCLALKDVEFRKPILDLGCGDGLFSLTHAGGTLAPSYDMFVQVNALDAFFDKVDIYNHFNADAALPEIEREPAYTIDVGLDHKEALLKKAFSTGLYETVLQADANEALPVEEGRFKTVFSNMLYWLDNHPNTLRELHRITAADGQVVLHVPSDTFQNYSFYQRLHVQTGDPKWEWLRLIDRNRSGNIKSCRSFEQWRDAFAAAGFKIASYRRYLSKTVLEAWDIGVRPISPYLIEMSNKLPPVDRVEIKKKWIEGLQPMLEPLCELEWIMDEEHPPGFFMFVLEKV